MTFWGWEIVGKGWERGITEQHEEILGGDECAHHFACLYTHTQRSILQFKHVKFTVYQLHLNKTVQNIFPVSVRCLYKPVQFPMKASWCIAHVPFKFITEKGELKIKLYGKKSKDVVKNDNFMLLKGTTNTKQQNNSS